MFVDWFVNEDRSIASRRKSHLDRMIFPISLIELREALSKPVCLDPANCVFSRIEYGFRAAKDFGCDVVFVQIVDFTRRELLPHITKQLGQSWPPGQRFYNTLQFGAFRLG